MAKFSQSYISVHGERLLSKSNCMLSHFKSSRLAGRREDKRNRVEHFEVKCVTAIDEEVRQFSRDELLSCAESVEIHVSIVGFKSVV